MKNTNFPPEIEYQILELSILKLNDTETKKSKLKYAQSQAVSLYLQRSQRKIVKKVEKALAIEATEEQMLFI